MQRTVIIKGPLTNDELLDIIAVVQGAERARPEDTFHVHIDHPEADERMEQVYEWMQNRPLAPGYTRILVDRPHPHRDASAPP